MKVYGQLERAQIENLTVDPTGVNLVEGLVWFRTDLNLFRWYDGAAVREAVDLDSAQTLTNKTLTAPAISDPAISGSSTYTEVGGTPATPAAGTAKFYLKDDGLFYKLDPEGNEIPVGSGGGGGLDVYHTEDFEINNAADFSTGNNATFLNGGVLNGTLTDETSSPISGSRSLKYTMGASSTNDWWASPIIELDNKQKENRSVEKLYANYNGDDGDIEVVCWDVTNSEKRNSPLDVIKSISKSQRYEFEVFIPTNTTQIQWGVHVITGNSGKILTVDDVEFSTNPADGKNQLDLQALRYNALQNTFQDLTGELQFPAGLTTSVFSGDSILKIEDDSGNTRTKFTALKDCIVNISFAATPSGGATFFVDKNGSEVMFGSQSTTGLRRSVVATTNLAPGDFLTIRSSSAVASSAAQADIAINATAKSDYVVTPASVSIENIIYTGYTSKDGSDRVKFSTEAQNNTGSLISADNSGAFTKITALASTYVTATVSGTSASQSVIMPRAYNSGGTELLGLSSKDRVDATGFASSSLCVRLEKDEYIVMDASIALTDNTNTSLTVLAFPVFATMLAAVPTVQTCYLKDEKSNGSSGGSFNNAAWRLRTLNSIYGDTWFCSLSSSQITLQPGKYKIKATAPAYKVDKHTLRLRNITAGSNAVKGGGTSFTSGGDAMVTHAFLSGSFEITTAATFELQHYCDTTKATNGFGAGGANANGEPEVFSEIDITKIR